MTDKSATSQQYNVTASYKRTCYGIVPALTVVRLRDKRLIYPFAGCADMPVCADEKSARHFAEMSAINFINGDIAVPE